MAATCPLGSVPDAISTTFFTRRDFQIVKLAVTTAHYLLPSPPGIGTSIRNELDLGASYSEDVAEYARTQVQSRVNRIPEEQAE